MNLLTDTEGHRHTSVDRRVRRGGARGIRGILLTGLLGVVLLSACDKKAQSPPPTPLVPPTPGLVEGTPTKSIPTPLATPFVVDAGTMPTPVVSQPPPPPEAATASPTSTTEAPVPEDSVEIDQEKVRDVGDRKLVKILSSDAQLSKELQQHPPRRLIAVNDNDRYHRMMGDSWKYADVPENWDFTLLSLNGTPTSVDYVVGHAPSEKMAQLIADITQDDVNHVRGIKVDTLKLFYDLSVADEVTIGSPVMPFKGHPIWYDAETDALYLAIASVDINPQSFREEPDLLSWIAFYQIPNVSTLNITFAPSGKSDPNATDLVGVDIDAESSIANGNSFSGLFAGNQALLPADGQPAMFRREPPIITLRAGTSTALTVNVTAFRLLDGQSTQYSEESFPFALGQQTGDGEIGLLTLDPTELLNLSRTTDVAKAESLAFESGILYSPQEFYDSTAATNDFTAASEWLRTADQSTLYGVTIDKNITESSFTASTMLFDLYRILEPLSYEEQMRLLDSYDQLT